MFFTSAEHKERFLAVMQEIDKVYSGNLDQEYSSALYILTASSGLWQKTHGYVSRDGISFLAILMEVDLSSGFSVLVRLAGNLFNSQVHIDPVEFVLLDESNFRVALTALQLRRHSYSLEEIG